ncbi:MAG: response regulator transcription factor [Bacteroidetes bacterium]|nr:response regulator transcription factor [Bacteroidota bacterium]
MDKVTRIIIVDDHSMFREGIKLLIEKEGLGVVIGEAENGKAFLDMLEHLDPDLVLMDIEMPVMDGVEATEKAKVYRPDLKILALSMLSNKSSYTQMIRAGAMGFVLKTSGKQELEKAIKTVTGGDCYFSNELLRQIIVNSGTQHTGEGTSVGAGPEFTERELEVLHYFCKGLTAKEVADRLCRSIKTIEAHRSSLLEKTNTRNTINLVLYAIKNKLVDIH